MNLYTGLLFLDGHIADPKLAQSLVREAGRPGSTPPDPRPDPVDKREAARCVRRRGAIASLCGALSLSPFR